MSFTDIVYSGSTLIGIINSVLNAISGNAANKKTKKQQEALQVLRSDIDKENLTDNNAISRLNNIITSLYNMRFQLDPRVIKKVDNAINLYSNKIEEANNRISNREDEYNQNVQRANNNAPTGTALDFFNSPTTFEQDQKKDNKNIRTTTAIKAENFESSIKGGNNNAKL